MAQQPLDPAIREKIVDLWKDQVAIPVIASTCDVSASTVLRVGRTVQRGLCGCTRPASHKGHCKWRAANRPAVQVALGALLRSRIVWTDERSAVVRTLYESGVDARDIQAELREAHELYVTVTAIEVHAGRLGALRPAGYQHYRGRPRGTKNKRPFPLLRLRDANGRLTGESVPKPAPIIPQIIPEPSPEPPKAPVPRGFSMMSMQGQDPLRDRRLAQIVEGSRGRV